jgi:phenylalanyl-tRNA synthetase beta chain
MRVPLSWLCDFAPFDQDAKQLAETMDELGLVVEELNRVGEGLSDVVVARVLEISAIPGADKIRKVVVKAGDEPIEVVCGAWNFQEGDLVALAPVGAVLPGGFEISRRKMKGVASNGMLCSGKELDLSEEQDGILVLGGAGGSPAGGSQGAGSGSGAGRDGLAEPGTPLVDALGIEPDVVFDIAVDANRPDAASVAGIARDVAAKLHVPFYIPNPPAPPTKGTKRVEEVAGLEVPDLDLCPRFTVRVLEGVQVGPSPREVVRRLLLAGMRSINNVVDASNYVMLELGQPTHPYDLDRVGGSGLIVRASRRGEKVTTLDGIERSVGDHAVGRGDDMRDCLICDALGVPIGIGGVMGGATSEIGVATTRVLLETAYFAPMAIARTSKRLGLRTEASSRFERGVDPEGIDRAALRLCQVLADSAGEEFGALTGVLDVVGPVPRPRSVTIRTERVNSVLGTELREGQIARYLTPIGFGCEAGETPGELAVTVPTFRPDTEREIDVIEEIGRHHGYGNIPRRRIFPPQVGGLSAYQRERRLVREVLAGTGADEAWTASLLAPGDHERAGMRESGAASELVLANPLTPEESVLRRSLLPGLLKALAFNLARRQAGVDLFEIGHVFPVPSSKRLETAMKHDDPLMSPVDERELLGLLLARTGDDAVAAVRVWHTLAEALGVIDVDLVAVEAGDPHAACGLHPTRTAKIVATAGKEDAEAEKRPYTVTATTARDRVQGDQRIEIGVVGEVDPSVAEAFGIEADRRLAWIELDLGLLLTAVRRKPRLAAPVSRFPSNDIDLAFVVDDGVPAGAVSGTLTDTAGELLESLGLFDVYRGPGVPVGTRSITWRLRFSSLDHTLTNEEVGALRARCIEAVERLYGARLRA